jgi:acid phosphatase (class A)
MNLRKLNLLLAAALLSGACASPAAKAILKKAHLVSAQVYYLPADQFKTIRFLAPPAPGSDGEKADVATVLDWQSRRTQAQCDHANLTAAADYAYFWGGKSPFPTPLPGEVKEFFNRVSSDLGSAVDNMKDRYRRPRPYNAYPDQVHPCIDKSRGYSYPSGHATFSRVFAGVMSDIVPERRYEFFDRAREIAQDRVIGGVHYPADIAAGEAFGDMFHAELLNSPAYQKDIKRIKTFLVK